MAIDSLELINFRSYKSAKFDLSPTLSVVVGPNGVGKTNLLEAIYVLGSTRSWRAPERALVRHTQKGYGLAATRGRDHYKILFETKGAGTQKQLHYNHQRLEPTTYIGKLPVVLFEPNSLAIINGEPVVRRRWLDQLLSMADGRYLKNLLEYKKVLRQRNHLLRTTDFNRLKGQIFAWDVSLARLGDSLVANRRHFIEFLQARASRKYRQITGQPLRLGFNYLGLAEHDYASSLLERLSVTLSEDARYGHSRLGPHREDVAINFKGRPIGKVASRGEQRTVALLVKLVELEFMGQAGRRPLLLLDDVLSELDERRRQFLINYLGKYQTVLSATTITGLKSNLPKGHAIIKLPVKS